MEYYVYDTNILLSHLDIIDLNNTIFIPSMVLLEIEDIKTNKNKSDDIKYNARVAARWLRENIGKYTIVRPKNEGEYISPDFEIIECAKNCSKKYGATFVTNDINCANLASSNGIEVFMPEENSESIYKGYKEITGSSEYINNYIANINEDDWCVNEYLIINNTDDDTTKEMRFDGEKFVALKLPSSKYIKGKNALQRCALDILANQDITVAAILGGYGSGKTYISMQMALYNVREKGNQSRILGVREVLGEGKEVGFLPGELESKTELFFAPLMQQLDGGEFELERLKQSGIIDSIIPFYMKGTTYNDTIILVDEAEDLNKKQLRLVGTRLGENSKIYLAGDYKQSVINTSKSNALIEMCNAFKGDPKFGCIYLGEDVRSTTSKMFADLFND